MPLDPQLRSQLRQIATYSLSSATADLYGETVMGSTATVYVRWEPRTREVELDSGTFVRTSHFLVVDAVSGFTPDLSTRFWLPGQSPATSALARQPKIVHPCVGELGIIDHWEIYL